MDNTVVDNTVSTRMESEWDRELRRPCGTFQREYRRKNMLKGKTAQKFDTGTDQFEFLTVCLFCELKICVGGSDCKEAKS